MLVASMYKLQDSDKYLVLALRLEIKATKDEVEYWVKQKNPVRLRRAQVRRALMKEIASQAQYFEAHNNMQFEEVG